MYTRLFTTAALKYDAQEDLAEVSRVVNVCVCVSVWWKCVCVAVKNCKT